MFDDDDYDHNCTECDEPCDCGEIAEDCLLCLGCFSRSEDFDDEE